MKNPILAALLCILFLPVSVRSELLLYEPFDYSAGGILTGQGGVPLGFAPGSTWETFVTSGTATFYIHEQGVLTGVILNNPPNEVPSPYVNILTNLATSGNFAGRNPGPNVAGTVADHMIAWRALDPAVVATFQPGTTTWFSYVCARAFNLNARAPTLAIGEGRLTSDRGNNSLGPAIGAGGFNNATTVFHAQYWTNAPGVNSTGVRGTVNGGTWSFGATPGTAEEKVNIVVFKIVWGLTPTDNDVVSVWRFLYGDVLDQGVFDANAPATAIGFPLDQSKFITLSVAGGRYFIDELRIGTTFADVTPPPFSGFNITDFQVSDTNMVFTWKSKFGKVYNIRSVGNLVPDPSTWTGFVTNIPATPPTNTLTVALPTAPPQFFVVEELPAPFADNFESGVGGWTSGSDGAAGTAWELGVPTATLSATGPASANSRVNCFATNISGDYGEDANIWLRSPAIDLTAVTSATLKFAQFTAIHVGDSGAVRVLDASDNSLLAVIPAGAVVDGTTAGWVQFSSALPAEAIGKQIKIEFRFQSAFGGSAGWYIDDAVIYSQ